MKIHLIKKQSIEDYVIGHSNSKGSFSNWLNKLKYAEWELAEDIQATYGSADLLGNGTNRVVFDIGGNNYRMICNMYLVRNRFIYSFVGLELMQNIQNCVRLADNIL